jgi:hypothetical protein
MSSILLKGVIRKGRVEVEEPIDLPDSTELLIAVPNCAPDDGVEEGWDVSPEGIAAWLQWCDNLRPLHITPDEQADTDAWLKKIDNCSAANSAIGWDARAHPN